MESKPGWKTTEFWIGAVAPVLVTVLNKIFGWTIDPDQLMAMFGAGGAYAVSRGIAKNGVKPE